MQKLCQSNGNVYQELYACPEILEVFKGGCVPPHPVCIRVSARSEKVLSSKSGFYGLKNLKFVRSLEKVLNLLEALYLKFYVFGL